MDNRNTEIVTHRRRKHATSESLTTDDKGTLKNEYDGVNMIETKTTTNISSANAKVYSSTTVAFVLFVSLLIVLMVIFVFIPYYNYKNAEKLIYTGHFDDAVNEFTQLGSFMDSSERINECHYLYGTRLLAQKAYDQAITQFELANHYSDSDEQILHASYEQALEFLASKNYNEAIPFLIKAGTYSDAHYLLSAIYNSKGEEYASKGKYDEAIAFFEMAGDYPGAKDSLNELQYNKAKMLYEEKDFNNAYEHPYEFFQGLLVSKTDLGIFSEEPLDRSMKPQEIKIAVIQNPDEDKHDFYLYGVNKNNKVMACHWTPSYTSALTAFSTICNEWDSIPSSITGDGNLVMGWILNAEVLFAVKDSNSAHEFLWALKDLKKY